MRIIGGELRGRRIDAPPGKGTRPMLDRVREAMFSTLAPWWAERGEARVLDLFAGSGSLGLEALSRGAGSARLVEADAGTARLLEGNVQDLGLEERTRVIAGDALEPSNWGDERAADVVFFDPPYPLLGEPASRARVLDAVGLLVKEFLADEGVLVFHAPRNRVRLEELEDLDGELVARERVYGSNTLWYLQRETE